MKGHFTPHTEETKQKLRIAKLGKPTLKRGKKFPQYAGPSSATWKGGKPKCSICDKQIGYGAKTCPEHRNLHQAAMKMVEKRKKNNTYTAWNKGLIGYRAGEKHHNWLGGITPINNRIRGSFEYKQWQNTVFKRDSFTCQVCNEKRKTRLVAHHIRNFAERIDLRTTVSNGVTLCRACHKIFHQYYGKKNNNMHQAIQFVGSQTTI
jgi:5-methylcytosine-specific restriction endonuclease McrA